MLDSPSEIRQMIWKFAKPEIHWFDADRVQILRRGIFEVGFDPARTNFNAPPLLLVCCQVYDEAQAFHRPGLKLNIRSTDTIDHCLGSSSVK